MSVNECITSYRTLAEKVFATNRPIPPPGTQAVMYSAEALEMAMKEVVKPHCQNSRCLEKRLCSHHDLTFQNHKCVKTYVLLLATVWRALTTSYRVVVATTKENSNADPILFRTYDRTTSLHDCAIWEVARATSAARSIFKSIKCGHHQTEFIDAAFGYNNPCEVLIKEAKNLYPGMSTSEFRVVSIGTGLDDVLTIQDTGNSIVRSLQIIAIMSKMVSERLRVNWGETNCYFRFDVASRLKDITFADWEAVREVPAYTNEYLRDKHLSILSCVESLYSITSGTDVICNGNEAKTVETTERDAENVFEHRLLIHRNLASQDAEQGNVIFPLGYSKTAEIAYNISMGEGSKQWNLI